MTADITRRIAELDEAIGREPEDMEALLRRGKLHYKRGAFGAAANDFTRVVQLDPGNAEAAGYLRMINEIQNYRNTDLLNP